MDAEVLTKALPWANPNQNRAVMTVGDCGANQVFEQQALRWLET
jgi:hypothetical protein